MTMKIRNCRIIRSSNCCFFSEGWSSFIFLKIAASSDEICIKYILIPDHLTQEFYSLILRLSRWVCVLTLLHTTHKYHHVSKEQQQEESFQVIGQMRRITSSVWLTHGPRPFRKSRHVLEPWVIGRSLAHHHSLSVASFVFIFGLLLSSPDDDIDLPPFFFVVEEFWSVKNELHHHSHIIGQALIQYRLTIYKYIHSSEI